MGAAQSKPCILGVDFGSTSLRAVIYDPKADKIYYVENKNYDSQRGRYDIGDFCTTGFPFSNRGKVYTGEDTMPNQTPISQKYFFYLLVNAKDRLLREYSLVQPLLERKGDDEFLERLRRGLRELFTVIRDAVREICDKEGLKIKTIALSIPAQWQLDFEDEYRSLVLDVHQFPTNEIFFVTETQALAHFLVRTQTDKLGCTGSDNDIRLFLDFGGHNMNGCMFNVVYHPNRKPNFYLIGDCFGAGGGSEQWEYNVGEIGEELMEKKYKRPLTSNQKRQMLDLFANTKMHLDPGNKKPLILLCEDEIGGSEDVSWGVKLTAEQSIDCFDRAMNGIFRVAGRQMSNMAQIDAPNKRVIISGRTCRNKAIKAKLVELCVEKTQYPPIFTNDFGIHYEGYKIAAGTAYAINNKFTVDEYMQGGAAFGIQMRQGTFESNENQTWDDTAAFLLDKDQNKVQEFPAAAGDELKLVGDPIFDDKKYGGLLHHSKCYDVLYFGRVPATAMWQFKLALGGTKHKRNLELTRKKRRLTTKEREALTGRPSKKKNKKRGRAAEEVPRPFELVDVKVFPIYADRPDNCVHIGECGKSLEELGLTMSPYDELPTKLFSEAEESGDEEEEDDASDASEEMPRPGPSSRRRSSNRQGNTRDARKAKRRSVKEEE